MYLLKAKKRAAQGPQITPISTTPTPAITPDVSAVSPALPVYNNDRYKNRQPQFDTKGRLPGIIKKCKYMATFKVDDSLSGQEKADLIKEYLTPLMLHYHGYTIGYTIGYTPLYTLWLLAGSGATSQCMVTSHDDGSLRVSTSL
eukprot:sb/3474051/